jgi:hypothetical protein
MTKGEKVNVVENYLVEERTASLLAGEIGLAAPCASIQHVDAVGIPGRRFLSAGSKI